MIQIVKCVLIDFTVLIIQFHHPDAIRIFYDVIIFKSTTNIYFTIFIEDSVWARADRKSRQVITITANQIAVGVKAVYQHSHIIAESGYYEFAVLSFCYLTNGISI